MIINKPKFWDKKIGLIYDDYDYKGKIVEHYPIKYYYALYRKKARNSIRFNEKSNESNMLTKF